MKFKDLYKVLVKTEFYYIKINVIKKETLRKICSEIISMTDLLKLEKYNELQVQCIHTTKYIKEYDYNITLYN
jgi:hypothetical protein